MMKTETTPTAITSPNHKKQNATKRNVVCVSGLNIDGKDYDIMKKILAIDDDDDRFFSFRSFSVTDRTFKIYYSTHSYVGTVGIAGEDDECRVWNLGLTSDHIDTLNRYEELQLIPELIIQLEDLRRLDLEQVTNFENQTATATLQWIGRLKNLRALTVSEYRNCGKMLNLSDEIGKLTNLQELTLTWCTEMISLPSSIGNLTNLRKLNLAYSFKLKSLPDEIIGRLTSLEELNLTATGIESLPSSIGDLTNLKKLDLSDNKKLQSLPDEIIGRLTSLEELNLTYTGMVSLPSSIGNLTNLKILYLSDNKKLQSLPDEIIGRLTSLEELNLDKTGMVSLPSSIGNLTNLKKLNLSGNKELQSLPDEIIGRLTSLEELYLDDTGMVSLPSSIGNLTNLKILGLSENFKLKSLPDEIIGRLTSLEELHLDFTGMVSLPSSICNLTNLRKLDLFGNKELLSLPDEILNITRKCPFLGCLGHEIPQECEALMDSLLRNRIRSLLLAPSSKIPPSLWPSIFHNANHASSSEKFLWCNCAVRICGLGSSSKNLPNFRACDCLWQHKLPQSDAIFHLLVELRAINHIISGQL